MKRYRLTLQVNGQGFEPKAVESVESDQILEVLALFPRIVGLVLSREITHLKEELESAKFRLGAKDDDIPF